MHTEASPHVLSASTVIGDTVRNPVGDKLGEIKEIMLDLEGGRIAYVVLSFGGLLGLGDKLFAVPWQALTLDAMNHEFVLDVEKDQLEDAPGFDKDNWPSNPDRDFINRIHTHYGYDAYYAS